MSLVIVTIKYRDESFFLDFEEGSLISDLKRRLEGRIGVPENKQQVIHDGKILRDDFSLDNFGEATLHVVRLADNNIMEASDDSFSDNTYLQDPSEGLFSMFSKSPIMKNIVQDENLIKHMMGSNPHIKSLVEKNPELEQLFNDPSFIKDTLEVMRNPEYQKELMRNHDRALSNIEMLPDGFNTLRKAYSTVQEPIFTALDESFRATVSEVYAKYDTPNKLNVDPIPNPWSRYDMQRQDPAKNREIHMQQSLEPRESSGSGISYVYKEQLRVLEEMGFGDKDKNIRALDEAKGNVHLAIEKLLQ